MRTCLLTFALLLYVCYGFTAPKLAQRNRSLTFLKDSTKPLLPPPPPPPPKPQAADQAIASQDEIPYPIAFVGVVAALSAALSFGTFFLREDKENREILQESQNSSPPAPSQVTTNAPATTSTDLSVPYDAAARLAYDEWRSKYNKGEYDASKFEKFKAKYLEAAVANVSAKKKAREQGTNPSLKELDENADQ